MMTSLETIKWFENILNTKYLEEKVSQTVGKDVPEILEENPLIDKQELETYEIDGVKHYRVHVYFQTQLCMLALNYNDYGVVQVYGSITLFSDASEKTSWAFILDLNNIYRHYYVTPVFHSHKDLIKYMAKKDLRFLNNR